MREPNKHISLRELGVLDPPDILLTLRKPPNKLRVVKHTLRLVFRCLGMFCWTLIVFLVTFLH